MPVPVIVIELSDAATLAAPATLAPWPPLGLL